MFNKKKCNCGRKISRNFDFCPYCGRNPDENLEALEKDFGLLGKEDLSDFGIKLPFGFNKIFNSLISQLDGQIGRQFKELDKEIKRDAESVPRNVNRSGISISINASGDRPPVVKVQRFGNNGVQTIAPKQARVSGIQISEEDARRLSKLPKKEAATKVRRLSNKIIYEIELPGVRLIKDVVVNKLENSIEIKAFSNNLAYFKLLPVNLPIVKYKLEEEKLILELASN